MPSLSIAISTMGLQVLSMINININVLRGSPVFVPLTIMNIFVRLEPQITLKDEYLYRSSIRQLYIYLVYQNIVVSQKETDDLHCQKHQQNL